MHAIIETGGKQFRVSEGDTLFIEKLPAEAGDAITFDKVLAVIDGDKASFGTPVVEGAKVEASLANAQKADRFQFMRQGYFCADSRDSSPEHLVFNRAVSLKDSFKPQ